MFTTQLDEITQPKCQLDPERSVYVSRGVNLTNHKHTKPIYLCIGMYMGVGLLWRSEGPDPKLVTLLGDLIREGRPIYRKGESN